MTLDPACENGAVLDIRRDTWKRLSRALNLEAAAPASLNERIQQAVDNHAENHFDDPDLFVAECRCDPVEWHWNSLKELLAQPAHAPAETVRVDYHQRMLAAILGRNPQLPLVSIVVPAFNETEEILRSTLDSALAQTYPNCEIILIDDGAEQPLIELVPDLAPRIRYIRQANSGVPVARNRGIAEARGEFVQFLDADDLLDPTCVEEKMRVFFAVADVELCFNLYRCEGDNGVKSAVNHTVPGVGDHFCPSLGLLRTILHRFPFQISSMLFPRWVLLDVGPFDVDLRQSQDNRQWFKLALRGTKVAGIKRELGTRRFRPGSLTSRSDESIWYGLFSFTRNLLDLCASPAHWSAVTTYLGRVLHKDRLELLLHSRAERVADLRTQIIDAFRRLPEIGAAAGYSCAPLAEALRWRLIDFRLRRADDRHSPFYEQWLDMLDDLAAAAPPVSEADFALWTGDDISLAFRLEHYPAFRVLETSLRTLADQLGPLKHKFWRNELRRAWMTPATTNANAVTDLPALGKKAA